tara:strand:+ start:100 stop:609 length:510 start_codon:yes stop_codon:yes gene_type:complete
MNHKAFTLIELLVVVAIIGILAAVGVTTFNGFQEKAKINALKANHKFAVKFISTELTKAIYFNEYKGSTSPKKCETKKYSSDPGNEFYYSKNRLHNTIFMCLTEFPDIYPNPLRPKDGGGGFEPYVGPTPAGDLWVGRTTCSYKSGKISCYARWGSGANDNYLIEFDEP